MIYNKYRCFTYVGMVTREGFGYGSSSLYGDVTLLEVDSDVMMLYDGKYDGYQSNVFHVHFYCKR